jgi:hypothetical protein
MKFSDIIITENFKTSAIIFQNQGIDKEMITDVFSQFKELVKKNQFKENERNIDWWAKQDFAKLKSAVNTKINVPTKTQLKRSTIEGNVITLRDDSEWTIIIPLDKDASCHNGRNTDWCTAKRDQDYFDDYFYEGGITLIYCINNTTGGKWALTLYPKGQTLQFDQQDNKIPVRQWERETSLSIADLIAQTNHHKTEIQAVRHRDMNAKQAFFHARNMLKGRFPEGEAKIATNGFYACEYARNILHGRFPAGEAAIATDANNSYLYARYVLKGRFPEGEAKIATNGRNAYEYAKNILHGRFPAGEEAIAADSEYAGNYTAYVSRHK